MSEELRAAAESIVNTVVKESSVNSTSYTRTEDSRFGLAEPYDLAVAYLAEHPADDDEPLTEEWLRSVGFTTNFSDNWHQAEIRHVYMTITLIPRGTRISDSTGKIQIPACQNRGDVRHLLRGLGIPFGKPVEAR